MQFTPLAFSAPLPQYEQQAQQLLAALHSGDPEVISRFNRCHPRFLDSRIRWLPRNVPASEIQNAGLDLADAELTLAREYGFLDWHSLKQHVEAATNENSPVFLFEAAVEAVIYGDADTLKSLLRDHPDLIRARSTRLTPHDPPMHRATLLHYIAANGVEGYRQRTPPNAVEIATILLEAGAEPDAVADMYGGQCTTMSMLVSSEHPAAAGLQAKLAEALIDFGASVNPLGVGTWDSPLMTALAFGYGETAQALVRRGARIENLGAAAGLGRSDDVRRMLPPADAITRHRAIALAAQHGHAGIVKMLLDAGEDPNRYNPEGNHSHSTPLHQAVAAGHQDVVALLVDCGADLEIKDTIWQGTPLGWAEYCKQPTIAAYLRSRGAKLEER